MADDKKGFVLYSSYHEILQDLSNEEAGILFKAILAYKAEGIINELPVNLKIAFKFIKNQFDIDDKKYDDFCEKQKANGLKGGRPKKEENPKNPTVFLKTQKTLKDKDKDKDKDVFYPPISPLDEKGGEEKTKEDPFLSEKVSKFLEIYKQEVKKPCRLSPDERLILLNILNDLIMQGLTIEEISQTVCCNLSKSHASGFFKKEAGINWLLRENNFYAVLNGEFLPKTDADTGGESREKDRQAVLEYIAKRKAKELNENEC